MTSIYQRIVELGQQRDFSALHVFLKTINEDQLINFVEEKFTTANFPEIWSFLLSSFKETEDCHRRRSSLALFVLKQIEKNDLPCSRINTIMNQLSLELPKFTSEDLAKLCEFCLECIQSQKTIKMGWKELLPEILNVLIERNFLIVDDLEYTGFEYKTNFINTLCMTKWSPNIVTNLATMFIDMPLAKEEHERIVNKLTSYIDKLIPQELPPFMFQLLKLCKEQHGRVIFFKLQTYFNLRVYENAPISESSPESFDIIESASNQEAVEAEGTVLYHIHNAASLGYECIKDFLSAVKNMTKAPELVLGSFQLMTLFTISRVVHYEETIFDVIRACIVRSYTEDRMKNNSAWFKDVVPATKTPEEVFQLLVQFSLQDREMVLPGLVNFGFLLLGVGSALGRDPIAEKQWTLGTMILLKIAKRKHMIARSILQTLSNHIVTRPNNTQYIECLYAMSKTFPLLMLENHSCVVELFDSLVQIAGPIANQLLDALIGLTKLSSTLRDHLIILLRKSLYARPIDTRQMAVNGYLKLIANLRISNLATLSQNSMSSGSFCSGHSLYTQISMSRTTQGMVSNFSNEALCLDVLSILKRCFMQQVEVRAQLYEGLYRAVCVNIELGVAVLDVNWFHFSQYYVMDEGQEMPLDFKKVAPIKDTECVLQEPLGKLIYMIGLVTKKVSEFEDGIENNTVIKFTNILESLCHRMKNCELVHFELNDGTDLFDDIPQSQQKVHVLRESMSVYEALIGYKIYSWNEHSEDQGKVIWSLFQGYNRLLHFTKSLSNPKKGDAKRKKGVNTTTQQTQAENTLRKVGQKVPFKVPETVMDFESITKTLHLLHDIEVPWTTKTEANVLKSKKEFHRFVMQNTIHLVQTAKRRKDLDNNVKKMFYDYLTDVASVVFKRIINRLDEFIEFDCATGVLAVECFDSILTVVCNNFTGNFEAFLGKIIGHEDFFSNLTDTVEVYQKLFEMNEEEPSGELDIKRLPLLALNTLETLANRIPSVSNTLSVQLCDWLKNFTYNNTVKPKVAMQFINLAFEVHIRYKSTLNMMEEMSTGVGDITGVITEVEHSSVTLAMINEATLNHVVLSLCNNLKTILENIEAVVARLRSEFNSLTCPGVENVENKLERLKSREISAGSQACLVISILTNLSNLIISAGNLSEAVFKSVMFLYKTLTTFTRYFISRSSKINLAFESARFDRLVKLAGKQLAPAVYKFILHIEEAQKQDSQPSQSKKKVDTSVMKNRVLRETRLIPKVVYEIEQFSKCVMQLSKKTNVDLSKYVGQGVVRDFRIKELRAVLEDAGELQESNLEDTLNSTVHSSESQDQNTGVETSEDIDSEDDASQPPSKRSKT